MTLSRIAACLAAILALGTPASLDACFGIARARRGPMTIADYAAKVQVDNVVARVKVEQTFVNPWDEASEATVVFPLPAGASVGSFSVLVDGKRIKHEVSEKAAARAEFERMVADLRAPALLEMLSGEIFQASIGAVPARGRAVVEVVFESTLAPKAGLFELRLPLKAAKATLAALPNFAIEGKILTDFTLQNVYSPSHPVVLDRSGPRKASFSYKAASLPLDQDFVLYFAASPKELGLNLMTHRVGEEDGYFLLLLSPPGEAEGTAVARDMTFVVDVSGSMEGDGKIEQAKRALGFCLDKLNPDDRFELIAFSSEVKNLTKGFKPADKASVAEARGLVQKLEAVGGTNIHGAMMKALANRKGDRPHVVVFMTDGEPTEGVTQTPRILADTKKANGGKSRVFVVGVGHNLNVKLMDGLAGENAGASVYVKPKEKLDEAMGAWFARIARPLLTGLSLDFGGIETAFLYPQELPDLFAGEQILVAGRYKTTGDAVVTLQGNGKDGPRSFIYDLTFPKEELERDFLPRLWAQRRVGYLLDQIRLVGENPELKGEVIRLSKEFSIVTPYTSFLVRGPAVDGPVAHKPMPRPAPPALAASWGASLQRNRVPGAPPAPARAVKGSLAMEQDEDFGLDEAEPAGAPMGGAADRYAALGDEDDVDGLGPDPESGTGIAGFAGGGRGHGVRALEASKLEPMRSRAPAAAPRPAMDLRATSGASAVQAAEELKKMKDASVLEAAADSDQAYVLGRVFRLAAGVWVDSAHDAAARRPVLKVKYGSAAYFALLRAKPALAKALALGERVLVVHEGLVIEVGPEGAETLEADAIAAAFAGAARK